MNVRCKSFSDNTMIPKKHTGYGEDISPEFIISDIPDGTVSFAIILDDLDVPWHKDYNHWIIWNIHRMELIPEGLPKGGNISKPITACQGNAWGKQCYRGPKPPFFMKKAHRYVFYVYALDVKLTLDINSKKNELITAMNGHILAETRIIGLYKNK